MGSPSVWGVFNRAFDRAIATVITGKAKVYVDDIMVASPTVCAASDQLTDQSVVRYALGHESINGDKSTPPCRCMDCIGWTIDLDYERVFPNEKERNKLAAVFFAIDLAQPISHALLQRMGSLAARYSQSIIGTCPFVHAVFEALKLPATSQIRLAVLVWRAVALTLLVAPLSLAVCPCHSSRQSRLNPSSSAPLMLVPKGLVSSFAI
jgi:hypothetical protein